MKFFDPVHPSIQVWVSADESVQFDDHYFETSDQKVAESLRALVADGSLEEISQTFKKTSKAGTADA